MTKIIKRELKNYFKQALRTVICFQLCFMPCYSYSADEKINPESTDSGSDLNNEIESILSRLKKEVSLGEMTSIAALGEAIETGKVEEYLKNHPRAVQERDHFLLANQSAESVEHHFDSEKGKDIEKAGIRIQLNRYTSSPYIKYLRIFMSVLIEQQESWFLREFQKAWYSYVSIFLI